MKKSFFLILFIAGIAWSGFSQEMNLENILDAYYKKVGSEKISKWQTMIITGKTIAGGGEYPFTVTIKRPDKVRITAEVQGMKMIQVFDGTSGWSVLPWTGSTDPQAMTEDQAKSLKDQAEIEGTLYNWEKKGHKVELTGKEDMEGTSAYKIKVIKANGNIETLFMDTENFVILKQATIMKIQGNETESESLFSDFREVEGVMMPFNTISKYKEQVVSNVSFEKVEVNKEVADTEFAKPEKK
jgi:hypothetical protein